MLIEINTKMVSAPAIPFSRMLSVSVVFNTDVATGHDHAETCARGLQGACCDH